MRNEARVKAKREFQLLKEDVAEVSLQRKKNLISLNEAERRTEREAQEAKLASREKLRGVGKNTQSALPSQEPLLAQRASTQDDGLQANERNLSNELAAEKARKNAKDILLDEAAHILSDEVGLLKQEVNVASRNKPRAPLTPSQKQRPDLTPAVIW